MNWEIVCPDGRVRHLPYVNRGDAEADAELCDERRCRLYAEPEPLELAAPPCQGAPHRVRPRAPERTPVSTETVVARAEGVTLSTELSDLPFELLSVQLGVQPQIERCVRDALRNGRALEEIHIVVVVEEVGDVEVANVAACTRESVETVRGAMAPSPRFQEAADALVALPAERGMVKALYYTSENWATAYVAIPASRLATDAGGQA